MKNLPPLLTLAFLVSCQTNADESAVEDKKPAVEAPSAPVIDASKPDSLIGQPLEKVKGACDAAGLRHRVVEIDGEPLPVTMDYMPERLNFKVKAGLITGVSKG